MKKSITKSILIVILALLGLNNITNAQSWEPVGTGVGTGPSHSVDVLNIYNGELIAAGRYTGITKWNGSNWSDFTGAGTATSILVEGNDLYSGGQFTGGDAFKTIKHYDGANWSIVGGSTAAYSNVYWNTNYKWSSIFKYNSNLYAVYDRGLLKFNSGTQQFVAVGDQIKDLGEAATYLSYCGTINNVTYFLGMTNGIQRIITWNDTKWDMLDMSNYPFYGIYSAQVVNNELFIGGGFQNTNNVISGMLKWNGTSLSEVLGYGNGIPAVSKLYNAANHLYAKYSINGVYYVGLWNGASFENFGGQLNTDVNAMAENSGFVYAGGFFSSFDGTAANNIVQTTTRILGNSEYEFFANIYANPYNEQLTIELTDYKNTIAKIFNLQGQLLQNITLQSSKTTIQINDMPSGLYLVKLKNPKGMIVKKIVKN